MSNGIAGDCLLPSLQHTVVYRAPQVHLFRRDTKLHIAHPTLDGPLQRQAHCNDLKCGNDEQTSARPVARYIPRRSCYRRTSGSSNPTTSVYSAHSCGSRILSPAVMRLRSSSRRGVRNARRRRVSSGRWCAVSCTPARKAAHYRVPGRKSVGGQTPQEGKTGS